MTFKLFLSVFCIGLMTSGAQVARAQPTPPKDENVINFRAVAWNRDLPTLAYDVKGKSVPLPLDRGRITQTHVYTGEPVLTFYNTIQVEGKPTRVPLTQVKLNPSQKKILVVIWLTKELHYVATVLEDENDALKGGQVRFVNLAGKELALNCNRRTTILPPGGRYLTDAANGGVGLKIAIDEQRDGQWKLAYMNGIEINQDERVTMFINNPALLAVPPEDEGSKDVVPPLGVFVLRDTSPPAPARQ